MVRAPCTQRIFSKFPIGAAALLSGRARRTKALAAEREVGDRLAAQRDREPNQLWNDGSTTLYLAPAPPAPLTTVARLAEREGQVGEAVRAGRVVAGHVAIAAGRARDRAGPLQARDDGRGLEEEVRELPELPLRALQAAADLVDISPRRGRRERPGRTKLRPRWREEDRHDGGREPGRRARVAPGFRACHERRGGAAPHAPRGTARGSARARRKAPAAAVLGIPGGKAKALVELARKLDRLTQLEAGDIPWTKVRTVTRAAAPESGGSCRGGGLCGRRPR